MAAVRLVVVFAIASGSGLALGQAGSRDERGGAATLPTSNEAMLQVGQVRQAIAQGDYRLAISLMERLMERPSELVVVPPARTYYPIWRQVARLIEQLPPEGIQLYRQLYDAEVAARLRDASQRGDVGTLEQLFQGYRASSIWPQVGSELVAQLLDQGKFAEALRVARMMEAPGTGLPFGLRGQLIAALAGVGDWRGAHAALADLEADPQAAQRPDAAQRLESLRRYVDALYQASGAAPQDRSLDPACAAGAAWRQTLDPGDPGAWLDDDGTIADVVERLHRLPLQTGVLAGGSLITRLRGSLWAFDALTLTPRWRVREFAPAGRGTSDAFLRASAILAGEGESDDSSNVSSDAAALLSHALRHVVSTGFGLVYTVETLPRLAGDLSGRSAARLAELGATLIANELVAREDTTGRLAWRRGADPDDPLYHVAFQDCPVVRGDHLYVVFQRGDDLRLAQLEPRSGQLVLEVGVVGPPVYCGPAGGRCLLAADESNVYVCTGNGVVAAFDQQGLGWQWAATYPSVLAERQATDWWPSGRGPRELGSDHPVVAGDLLVVAPVDSPYLIALDRFTGRQRWRIERRGTESIVGASDEGLLVAADGIACLRLTDGGVVWRSVALDVTGRPVLHGERLFVPTRDGVVEIDAQTGKLTQAPPRLLADAPGDVAGDTRRGTDASLFASLLQRPVSPLPAANLVACSDALFAVSPNSVVKFADVSATRRVAEGLLEQQPDAPRARLALAWADRLEGDFHKALTELKGLDASDATIRVARDQLMTEVLVALAQQSPAGPERLAWLREAAGQGTGAAPDVRLSLLIGAALQESGAWDEAVAQYADVLRQPATAGSTVPDGSGREAADWLYAAERLRDGLMHLDDARRNERLETWLAGASAETLERLRLVAPDGVWAKRIDRALLLSALPPELRLRSIAAAGEPGLPEEEQRRLWLARWDTHVALGMRADALDDEKHWFERFDSSRGSGADTDDTTGGDEALRVRRIQAAMKDVDEFAEQPWTAGAPLRRQWKVQRAELVCDSRLSVDSLPACVVLREFEDRALTLHSTVVGTEYQRTADALQEGAAGRAAQRDAVEALLGFGHADSSELRATWPAAIWSYLAAVPVRGGLVGLGLGLQRGGGRRLWEQALPEWSDAVPKLDEMAVAGPLGVYLVRRNERVGLMGWADGGLWWERELSGLRPRQLFLAGDRLIVVGQDGGIISIDATYGDQVRVFPSSWGTPRAVAMLADRLVVWSETAVAEFAPDSFERVWTQPCRGIGASTIVPNTTWLLYRDRVGRAWECIDVRTGQPAFEHNLGEIGQVLVAAVSGGRLLVASYLRPPGAHEVTPPLQFWSFDAATGASQWHTEVETEAPLNYSQLVAGADAIPILIAGNRDEFADGVNYRALTLRWVDKHTGALCEPVSIHDDFRESIGVCEACLLATPSRIIVQANGTVAAYGTSAVTSQP